jgi:hypothetical protein
MEKGTVQMDDTVWRRAVADIWQGQRRPIEIYARTEDLEGLIAFALPRMALAPAPWILWTHNSVVPVTECTALLNCPTLVLWGAQNYFGPHPHPRVRAIPVGLGNGVAGGIYPTPAFLKEACAKEWSDRDKVGPVILAPRTHASRRGCLDACRREGWVIAPRQAIMEFWRNMAAHQFTIAPRGRGMDTHRFWEAVMLGCVPVVVESYWRTHFPRVTTVSVPSWAGARDAHLALHPDTPSPVSPSADVPLSDRFPYMTMDWWDREARFQIVLFVQQTEAMEEHITAAHAAVRRLHPARLVWVVVFGSSSASTIKEEGEHVDDPLCHVIHEDKEEESQAWGVDVCQRVCRARKWKHSVCMRASAPMTVPCDEWMHDVQCSSAKEGACRIAKEGGNVVYVP